MKHPGRRDVSAAASVPIGENECALYLVPVPLPRAGAFGNYGIRGLGAQKIPDRSYR